VNDILLSAGVFVASVAWQWARRRPSQPISGPAPLPRGDDERAADAGLLRLRVVRVVHETADATTLHLLPEDGVPLAYRAGQFLALRVHLGESELWRAYSLSSSPLEGPHLALTIKRISGGRVSAHLQGGVAPGDVLEARPPTGAFTVTPQPGAGRHLVFVAGGSGITPVRSLLHTLVVQEPDARLTLLYGNRRREDVLFLGELEALARAHGGRVRVRHVLEEPPAGWQGGVGRLDGARCAEELDALGAFGPGPTRFLLCGPAPMREAARAVLQTRGLPEGDILEERFTSAPTASSAPGGARALHTVRFRTREGVREVEVAGHTLLEAARHAGVALPSACERGVCGTCRVRVCEGAVEPGAALALGDAERAQGHVLACTARATSDVLVDVSREG